jgi:uncharacterized membrane protein
MLDLTMALQWVYDNIYAFNGNKDLITVYGPGITVIARVISHLCYIFFFLQIFIGAGAAAAGLLAITPGSSHMVRQVFGQVSDHIILLRHQYTVFNIMQFVAVFKIEWISVG